MNNENKLRILHITDFHLDNKEGPNENLREGFYDEFIDGLIKLINTTFGGEKIDYIISTGDFVNMGKVENFSHIEKVLKYLAEKLGLTDREIGICIGNHDINRGADDMRASFKAFQGKFIFGEIMETCGERAIHYYDSKKQTNFISLDSIYPGKGDKPCILDSSTANEIDKLLAIVKKIPKDEFLIIASHYPIFKSPLMTSAYQEANWEESHLWRSAHDLAIRIMEFRENCETLWLHGDGHVPDFFQFPQYKTHNFVMTGMIGGDIQKFRYSDKGGNPIVFEKKDEVKVIDYNSDNITFHTFSYEVLPSAQKVSPHVGIWKNEISNKPRYNEKFGENSITNTEKDSTIQSKIKFQTEVISDSTQKIIMDEIQSKKLYSLGRFNTSDENITLGWISIGRLFEKKEILTHCVDESYKWLVAKNVIISQNTIFIGLDYWGAVLASQVSIKSNIKNFCVTNRAKGRHSSQNERYEFICEEVKKNSDINTLVFFTDVLSSGSTVYTLFNDICSTIGRYDLSSLIISIISDKTIHRSNLDNFHSIGTFCGDLKIPIVKKSELPDEAILKPTLDFR